MEFHRRKVQLCAAEFIHVSSATCPDPVSPGGGGYLTVATPKRRALHVPNKMNDEPRLCKSQMFKGDFKLSSIVQERLTSKPSPRTDEVIATKCPEMLEEALDFSIISKPTQNLDGLPGSGCLCRVP